MKGVYRNLVEHEDGTTTIEGTNTRGASMNTKVYMVSVESEGLSADWLDDVIVVATSEADAVLGAEQAVREYRPHAIIKGGEGSSEVYTLATEHPRVVGILVPRDER